MFFKRPPRFGGVLKTSLARKQEDSAINQFKLIYKLKGSNCGLVMNSYLNDNLEDKQFFSLDSFSSKTIPPFFLFFSFSVECVSWYLVGRPAVGLKKIIIIKNTVSLGTGGPGTPGWLYVAMLLLCSFSD